MRRTTLGLFAVIVLALLLPVCVHAQEQANDKPAELTIPAYTGYTQSYTGTVWMTKQDGITRWNDPAESICWYGKFKEAGQLDIKLTLRLKSDATRQYKLTVGEQAKTIQATGLGLDKEITIDFGTFDINEAGFHAISLNCLSEEKEHLGDLSKLILTGSAVQGAHFNLEHRRNSASEVGSGTGIGPLTFTSTGPEMPAYETTKL